MTLAPLLAAPAVIQVHALAALSALLLGAAQFLLRPKGGRAHHVMGWSWAGLMAITTLTAAFIYPNRPFGSVSPVHALVPVALATLAASLLAARRGRVGAHRRGMIMLYGFALGVTGAFTLLPWRIMGRVMLGE